MASSGSFSGSIKEGHYKLRVDWSQSKNLDNNTSTVTCKMYLVNDYSLSIKGRENTCTIDGTQIAYSSPAISSTGTHLLGTASKTVNHNSDGSKFISISAVFNIQATLSGTFYSKITASANITLDSIARASTVSSSDMTMGSAGTIKITRASSSFTHTLTYTFGSATGTIAAKTTATSVAWTPTVSLANQIPNATSGVCTITCITYNVNTKIGSKTCTLSLLVPSSVKPTISSLSASRIDGTVPAAWGIYVQTKSKVKLIVNGAAGSYGSTIKSYAISGGGYSGSASTLTTGFLNNAGTVTFQATVTDSRGRVSGAATVSITVTAYSPPYFQSTLTQRCLSTGTLNDDGMYLHGLVVYGFSSCGWKNTVTRMTQYKKVSDANWVNAGVAFNSNQTFIFGGGQISTETSYDVKYTLTDAFGSISVQEIISTAAVVMDFKSGGKGVAVGKVSEKDNTFEVSENWDVRVYGKLLKDYIQQFSKTLYPVGSIYLSVNNTNPSTLFGGIWEQLKDRFLLGAGSTYANGSTGGAATVTLQSSQIPAHNHSATFSSGKAASAGNHTHTLGADYDGGGGSTYATIHKAATGAQRMVGATSNTGAHTHNVTGTVSVQNTGGGASHNNMPPYLTVYMWKRTA